MRLDLYTDAGVKNGLATWGCVLVVGGVPLFEAHGQFRDETTDSTAAELRAVANALHKAIRAGLVEPGSTVRVICDNSRVVGLIKGKVKPSDRKPGLRQREGMAAISKMAEPRALIITACGVKGHQPIESTNPHAPHNRRCDLLCRIARGEKEPNPPSPPNPKKAERRRKRALANMPPFIRRELEAAEA